MLSALERLSSFMEFIYTGTYIYTLVLSTDYGAFHVLSQRIAWRGAHFIKKVIVFIFEMYIFASAYS